MAAIVGSMVTQEIPLGEERWTARELLVLVATLVVAIAAAVALILSTTAAV